MKGKPDISQFLDGAATKETSTTVVRVGRARVVNRMTKTIRLATDLEAALKDAAYERSKNSGQRITESDLIDEALRKYFNI